MKNLLKQSMVLVLAAFVLAGCNCYKKMAKNASDVTVVCKPEVLTLNNGVIPADITVTFPEKYYNAKAILKITPVLVFQGGELASTPRYLQGSKVDDNYPVVESEGGVYNMHVDFPYDARMGSDTRLELRAEVKCAGSDEFVPIDITGVLGENYAATKADLERATADNGLVVASGLNLMQNDFKYEYAMETMPNNYKKVTSSVDKAEIKYAINDSKVDKRALNNNEGVQAFRENVEQTQQNDRATQHLSVKGYASPDGPENFNEKLSGARSESGKAALEQLLKDSGLEIDAAAYGEDWEGFKELVEKSDIQDKDVILQVLSLYSSSAQRENEIKNISSVYGELKDDILPQLRRAQLINNMEIEGKTDAEIKALIDAKRYDELDVEELLYAAETLTQDNAQRVDVLSYTAKTYNDARAYNNLGAAQAAAGDQAAALASFEKAMKNGASNATINKNLALANLANGNIDEAKKYAQSADAETKSAIAAAEGKYDQAAKGLTGYNAAVAYVMNEDLSAAKKALAGEQSADADYLRAVIASKEGDLTTAGAQLKSAVAKDPSLAEKAVGDVNLRNLFRSGFKF